MSKTLSNIVIRNENLQTISQVTVVMRLIFIIIQFKILVVTQKLRERERERESYYLGILKLQTVVYGFQFTSPINKELRFSRDYYVKDYPEQHQFACHQLGIYRKTLQFQDSPVLKLSQSGSSPLVVDCLQLAGFLGALVCYTILCAYSQSLGLSLKTYACLHILYISWVFKTTQ